MIRVRVRTMIGQGQYHHDRIGMGGVRVVPSRTSLEGRLASPALNF